MAFISTGMPLSTATVKSGMSEPTARKYRTLGKRPSQVRQAHHWRSRPDLFVDVCSGLSVFKQMGQMFGLAKGVFCSSFSCYAACR